MKIIYWNIHGGKKPQAIAEITNYVSTFKPDILFVMETMTSNRNSKQIIRGLHFRNSIIIDPLNHCGGLWVCWNNNNTNVTNNVITERCAHLTVTDKPTRASILVSGAYFAAQKNEKDSFWESMTSFYNSIQIHQILLGDFNELLTPEDKTGGNPINPNQCTRLPNFLAATSAIPINCTSQSFSWKSKQHTGLYQRLDRAVAHDSYLDHFPRTSFNYGTFTISDHAPIFLNTNPDSTYIKSTFRFQNHWFVEKDAEIIVRKHWLTNIE